MPSSSNLRRWLVLALLSLVGCESEGSTTAVTNGGTSAGAAGGSGGTSAGSAGKSAAGEGGSGAQSGGTAGASGTASGGGGTSSVAGGGSGGEVLGPKFDTSAAIVHVDFEAASEGAYTQAQAGSDFGAEPPWNDGLEEGRGAIVADQTAYAGKSLRILYPAASVGPTEGGAQFIVALPDSYDELYLAYRIAFASGFDFVKGGKIPGLSGGANNTGGDKPTGTDGWSGRMMWREQGKVVTYLYHPDQPTQYGEDLDWNLGSERHFAPGTWHLVEHRIVMNTPAQHDGVVQCWFDGELALERNDIRFRDVSSFAIDSFYFSTFFGGSDSTWAASKDEYAYFDDIVIAEHPITH